MSTSEEPSSTNPDSLSEQLEECKIDPENKPQTSQSQPQLQQEDESSEWETEESDYEIDIIIQLKITLRHVSPKVWRRIQVSSSDLFEDLHYYIQEAMGWRSCHQHSFRVSGVTIVDTATYDLYKDCGHSNFVKEEDVSLSDYFEHIGDMVLYEYDHGDAWEHEILFEKFVLTSSNPYGVYPRCVGGKRACPPEDCGGAPGYMHLLKVLGNPEHADYEDLVVNWLSEHYPGFDPDKFDKKAVFKHVFVEF